MKNIPRFIFLQTGIEDCGETCNDFDSLNMVSWCAKSIYSDDLQYISVDFILARIKELQTDIKKYTVVDSDTIYNFNLISAKISELKKLLK